MPSPYKEHQNPFVKTELFSILGFAFWMILCYDIG